MSEIEVTPLGAGQDVGRSCILVSVNGKNIMLDCGMHMGFNDERRFPDFTYITDYESVDKYIDCVIISHFHLDHCGALPYLTQIVGYSGPIYMTPPTKAICPILLEDYRKVSVEHKGGKEPYSSTDIKECMKKVKTCNLHEVIEVSAGISIKAYYAGHVLGAAMMLIKCGAHSILYTGDYNMTADRHLGAAWIDKCQPDLLITESTYATTIRESKKCRESDFLNKVHETLESGGKVLIPVFALGRAQELCVLVESYWDRMNLNFPLYFTQGLTDKANYFYKSFISWTSEKIKETFVDRNLFDFKHIKPWEKNLIDHPRPLVCFATPGMLHAGQSLQIFKAWASNPKNCIIMPGYCVHGTVGQKVLSGAKLIKVDSLGTMVEVKLSIEYMSFSAHADARGIIQLISNAKPKAVLLVHGEKNNMVELSKVIIDSFSIPCFMPCNGETVKVSVAMPFIPAKISKNLLNSTNTTLLKQFKHSKIPLTASISIRSDGIHVEDVDTFLKKCNLVKHDITFTSFLTIDDSNQSSALNSSSYTTVINQIYNFIKREYPLLKFAVKSNVISGPITIKIKNIHKKSQEKKIVLKWSLDHNKQGEDIMSSIRKMLLNK